MGRRGRGWAAEGYFLYFFFVILFLFFSKVIFYEGQIHSSEEQDKYRIGCHLCPLKKKSSHSCYSGRKLKIETQVMFPYQITNKTHRELGNQKTQRSIYDREVFENSVIKLKLNFYIIQEQVYSSEGKGKGASSIVWGFVPGPC